MPDFFQTRGPSLSMVVFVLLVIVLLQGGISYSTAFGAMSRFIPGIEDNPVAGGWIGLRVISIAVVLLSWLLTRKRHLFRAIIVTNSLLTLGLFILMSALLDALRRFSSKAVESVIVDVPHGGIEHPDLLDLVLDYRSTGGGRDPTRGRALGFRLSAARRRLPHYESWVPRYTDYLYLAFTASFAFSPTDTLPLTRRAKMLMLLQSAISIITLTAIAGSAINILAGNG